MYIPDNLDLKIIRSLNKNARRSYREIARELKVSLTTIVKRIKRLESSEIIKGYIPIIDLELMNYELQVIIGVRISHGKLIDVQKQLSKSPHVYEVYDVTGDWDSIVIAKFKNRSELNKFIKNILATEYVERTNTSVVLNVVKDEKRLQI